MRSPVPFGRGHRRCRVATLVADRTLWRRLLTASGIGLTAFSAYLAVQLMSTFRELSADPLMVAQLGPGLGLVIIGSVAILATSAVGDASTGAR